MPGGGKKAAALAALGEDEALPVCSLTCGVCVTGEGGKECVMVRGIGPAGVEEALSSVPVARMLRGKLGLWKIRVLS